ncbi:MAG: hypothetical protein CME93_03760 [Hyphomonadaceae bacterium]|nr:hypothetical protein [Hyphomonadaceae bacterium]OUX94511.1 MAG: hypothetical protein CBB77_05335 [Hyphomonas sp. TMED17]
MTDGKCYHGKPVAGANDVISRQHGHSKLVDPGMRAPISGNCIGRLGDRREIAPRLLNGCHHVMRAIIGK